ncbi:DUF1800 domain-containing protein [Pseudohaliea rubra]|uniref:DUF1800 domain-containing protein n=1 Tax=Pseudohaliea rubra DSM 19751 TaxID=1265313 RepID=A0A095WZY4_9GAMM|nr:DUF1800 family protein [Pseudohaliea rubra]KGE04179.1 hypothetical protein HRUBRA_01208 [Pseudohaliea rubra DSM 19751]
MRSHVLLTSVMVALSLAACGGGGGGGGYSEATQRPPPIADTSGASGVAEPEPEPEPEAEAEAEAELIDDRLVFATEASTARFLAQATFGATPTDLNDHTGTSISAWFRAEMDAPPADYLGMLDDYQARLAYIEFNPWNEAATTFAFWRQAIGGEDQLRQRMVYALSQLLVVSNAGGDQLTDIPEAVAYHQQLLTQHAFGNYRDLLEAITWSPGMGFYLTYMGNQKGDATTGRMPDENYARELLQLFTLGLVALNPDGSPRRDSSGDVVELYDNRDITGLARVFTGLDRTVTYEDGGEDPEVLASWRQPMVVYPELHSPLEKTFLSLTIPAGTSAEDSITMALDHIIEHPNVGPFVARQLVQRFTTSDPDPAYVARVAAAFDRGRYPLPDGGTVGDGRKGDLAATLAAILLDPENFEPGRPARFGKLREPVLRLTQWARAFKVSTLTPEYTTELWDLSAPSLFGQHPFRAPSVFNFYRPGFTPPGTESGALGMTVPELQITNAASIPGYNNTMSFFIFGRTADAELDEYRQLAAFAEVDFDPALARSSFIPDYSRETALADDVPALLAHLDTLLTGGQLSDTTIAMLQDYVSEIPLTDDDNSGRELRAMIAINLIMSAPDYWVQR